LDNCRCSGLFLHRFAVDLRNVDAEMVLVAYGGRTSTYRQHDAIRTWGNHAAWRQGEAPTSMGARGRYGQRGKEAGKRSVTDSTCKR
jgi:hypothetical protein